MAQNATRSMKASSCDFFIIAGEESGDAQGEMLLKALLSRRPSLKIAGVLGPKMRAFHCHEVLSMEDFNIMGFTAVLQSIGKIWKQFFYLKKQILTLNPQAVIFIDYPGFNLKMAQSLRKSGYRGSLIQHVCPSVWAWKKNRIKLMQKHLDLVLCLFPFEKNCFDTLETVFVGHPLVNKIKSQKLAGYDSQDILSIFPGSREKEVFCNLPLQLKTCTFHTKNSTEIVISCARDNFRSFIEKQICQYPSHNISITSSKNNATLMQRSRLALATSGTITLELALYKIPTLVTYFINKFDFFLARKIFKIDLPHYCIVNYLAQKRIFPEFYGPHFCEDMLFETFRFLYDNDEELMAMKQHLSFVSKILYNEKILSDCAEALLKKINF